MRLVFGVLADYFAVLADHKLVVAGIFDSFTMAVRSENMPVQVPAHWIVVRIGMNAQEVDVEHRGQVRLRDEDGREIFLTETMPIRAHKGRLEGIEHTYNWGNNLSDLTLPRCGTYSWEIVVNGQVVGEIPFSVVRAADLPAVMQRRPINGG